MCFFHALLNITGSRCDSACKHLPRIMVGISDDTVPFLAVYNSTQPSCLAKNKCLCICMALGQKKKNEHTGTATSSNMTGDGPMQMNAIRDKV